MFKKIIIFIIIVAVIIFIIIRLNECKNTEVYTIDQNIYDHDDEGRKNINVSYPELQSQKNLLVINQTIKQEMEKIISNFKKKLSDWDDTGAPEKAYSALQIDYQTKLLNNSFVSLYFTISENLAGAAHPNNYSLSLNFNLETNKKIELDDLFKTEDYLTKISELVVADLTKQFEERDISMNQTFESGTAPTTENYENFNITYQGISFNFDQYQLAPYAAGSFRALILYDALKDDLEDKFKL